MNGNEHIVWAPQKGPQKALIDCPLEVVFFGGARGGGKTDGCLGKWALKEAKYGADFNAIMFRRTTTSAEDAVERSMQIYGPLGGKFNSSKLIWRMPNGGRVAFAYLDSISDANQYQGRNLTDAWIEEVGQYDTPVVIDRLFAALRSPKGVPTQMILTGNPGGAGQHWIAKRFDLIPLSEHPKVIEFPVELPDRTGSVKAAVIPSRLKDNQILMKTDPGYETRLAMSGGKELVRAWLEGDWAAVEGAYFDCWSNKMILRPFSIPRHWTRFMSFDWGSAKPFSVGWWAIASDEFVYDGKTIPSDALIRYKEWYGAKGSNVGLKLTAEEVRDGILERDDGAEYGIADPAIFSEDGGPSIAERMRPILWRPADNKRVSQRGHMGGWDMMRQRMESGMIYCFSTCVDSIRTIPVLQHDPKKAEDLDSSSEDHAADEWRYACMSRPWAKKLDTQPAQQDAWGRRFRERASWKTN